MLLQTEKVKHGEQGSSKPRKKEKRGEETGQRVFIKKNPKPVKGMSLGGLGWASERKDGASPLRHMTRGEAAVVQVKTLNPKARRGKISYIYIFSKSQKIEDKNFKPSIKKGNNNP